MPGRLIALLTIGIAVQIARGDEPRAVKRVARTDGGRELLANPALQPAGRTETGRAEADRAKVSGWGPYDAGYRIEPRAGRDGGPGVACDNPDGGKRMGLSQTLKLDRQVARPLLVSGWSKAEGVTGSSNLDYSIYADIEYQDGTALWAQVAQFTTGTHDWEHQRVRILPEKPIRTITVNVLFRGRPGKVWFDDVSLQEFGGEGGCIVFDGA